MATSSSHVPPLKLTAAGSRAVRNWLGKLANFTQAFVGMRTAQNHRAWISDDHDIVRVYVRIGQRFVDGASLSALTLASIDVDEDFQHQGIFQALLRGMQKHLPDCGAQALFVESVLSEHLPRVLARENFSRLKHDPDTWVWVEPVHAQRSDSRVTTKHPQ